MSTESWLIIPVQPDPIGPVEFQAHRMFGQDSFFLRSGRAQTAAGGDLISDNFRIELDRYLWRDQPHVASKRWPLAP